jgi:2'-5' RNA ligase
MRTFIAIELPPELKDKITKFISELKAINFCNAKWVSEQQLHLTLKFLGEIDKEKLEKVKILLNKKAQNTSAFSLQLKGLGHFNQRVLWIGGGTGQKQAIALANEIDSELNKIGFVKEMREFSVHLTLARMKYITNKTKFKEILEKYANEDFGFLKVNKIALIESILTKQGPVYKTLCEFLLKF